MVYTAPGKELSWWRPTGRPPGPGFALLRPIFPNSRSSNATFIPSTLLGTTTQANLEPILEKAKTSQARKRRREPERSSSVLRELKPALPENGKNALQLPPTPAQKVPRKRPQTPKKCVSPRPHPDFPSKTLFYALSCKNAFRTSSGVSRTPSSGTPSRRQG
jgi:hypothetical protein